MDRVQLRARIEQATRRLVVAEQAMESALRAVEPSGRAEKEMISDALRAAFDELRTAKNELLDLEHQIAVDD